MGLSWPRYATRQVQVSNDQRRTVLSSEHERRNWEFVGGPVGSGLDVEGEKATAYTGPEWPTRRRDEDGCSETELSRGLPSMDQTRMYDSAMPAATSLLSPEKSMQFILLAKLAHELPKDVLSH